MKCPICANLDLLIAERHGIEIDYCPNCRGVWLDRGELDKIIDRANAQAVVEPVHTHRLQSPYQANHEEIHHSYDHGHGYDRDYPKSGYGHGQRPKKKKSFLGELFDFD